MTVGGMSVGGVLPECWPVLGESVFSGCSPSLRIVESGSNFLLALHVIGRPDGIDARDRWIVRLELSACRP